jgi:hypothetical protein
MPQQWHHRGKEITRLFGGHGWTLVDEVKKPSDGHGSRKVANIDGTPRGVVRSEDRSTTRGVRVGNPRPDKAAPLRSSAAAAPASYRTPMPPSIPAAPPPIFPHSSDSQRPLFESRAAQDLGRHLDRPTSRKPPRDVAAAQLKEIAWVEVVKLEGFGWWAWTVSFLQLIMDTRR